MARVWLLGPVLALLIGASAPARAFQIETPFTGGCHEAITTAASRTAGWPGGATAPAPTGELARAAADVTFTPPPNVDAWTLALLLGVRSNDIQANAPTDVASLVHIHNDPDDQVSHCCRRQEDNGAAEVASVGACRAFIEAELEAAGLFADTIDLDATEPMDVFLAIRGKATLEVPRFAYRLGRALHALEDGFTHTFRNPQTGAIRHMLNWIDFAASERYDPAVDGYPHVGALDDCRRDAAGSVARVTWATAAAHAVMAAVADDTGGGAGRRARVAAALDEAMAIEAGCDASNDYCDAPELAEAAGCGCGVATGGDALLVGALALLGLRRRRRRTVAGAAVLLGLGLHAGSARAEAALTVPPARHATWLYARAGAALDRGGLAATIGARVDRGRLGVGGLAEWNPWFSLDARRITAGALNAAATVDWRWLETSCLALHSRVEVGASTVLIDLVGVDQGNTGLYLGASLLGVSLRLGERARLTIDPSHLAVPAPQLTGFPFYYRQYRVSVGLEVAL